MKKQSNLSRLMGYAGKHKILTYLSWIDVYKRQILLLPVPIASMYRAARGDTR